jgi:hypothetical protein
LAFLPDGVSLCALGEGTVNPERKLNCRAVDPPVIARSDVTNQSRALIWRSVCSLYPNEGQ